MRKPSDLIRLGELLKTSNITTEKIHLVTLHKVNKFMNQTQVEII